MHCSDCLRDQTREEVMVHLQKKTNAQLFLWATASDCLMHLLLPRLYLSFSSLHGYVMIISSQQYQMGLGLKT